MTKGETLKKIDVMIDGCQTYDQLSVARKYLYLAHDRGKLWGNWFERLSDRITEKQLKLMGVGNE